MRQHAVSMGYTMNEHGLYSFIDKKKGDKVNHLFKTEKDIFEFLNLEYKSPTERIDGRAVVVHKKIEIEKIEKIEENMKPKNTTLKNISKPAKKILTQHLPSKKKLIIEEENCEDHIIHFKKNGISVLEKLNEIQLTCILTEANKQYHNHESNNSKLTDNEYDIMKEFTEKKYPSNLTVKSIGATPTEKNKVILPYQMASMDKIKPDTSAWTNWINKFTGPYVVSCKLDGVSGLYTTENNTPKLYTRGDGKIGQDVSHLIPYLNLPNTKNIVVRGEIIISKNSFDTKYKDKFANPRNMVAGIVNSKISNIQESTALKEILKDIHFVAYEVIKPILPPLEQMKYLESLNIQKVIHCSHTVLSNDILSSVLVEWRNKYVYEIDGIIVTNNKIYERKSGNPEHAFAFKMVLSDQVAEAKVVDVIWTPSKDGYLKPRVQIEPIHLGGVCIEYATGFNGSFIHDNKIGIGAVIELIRSGDVIPYIRKVIVPAQTPKMPSSSIPYKWNETHIDILLEDIHSDDTVKEKNITGFFRGIGVEGLSSGNIARIIQGGHNSIAEIIHMTVDDLLKIDGFKIIMATKIHDGIKNKIATASLITIMSASNLFGRGFSEKKLELIMESYPNVLLSKESNNQKIARISSIKGMAEKTSEAFVERIGAFIQFIKEVNLEEKLTTEIKNTPNTPNTPTHLLNGKTVVMTGFRDDSFQQKIKNIGVKLGTSVSKNTFVLIVKDDTDNSNNTGKLSDASKLGIPIMTISDFTKKYL